MVVPDNATILSPKSKDPPGFSGAAGGKKSRPVPTGREPAVSAEKNSLILERLFVFIHVDVRPAEHLLHVDAPDPGLRLAVEQMVAKMQTTLDLCRSVVADRTPYRITQEWVETRPVS